MNIGQYCKRHFALARACSKSKTFVRNLCSQSDAGGVHSELDDDIANEDFVESTIVRRRRGAFERKDSVSEDILLERVNNRNRLHKMRTAYEEGKSVNADVDQLRMHFSALLTDKFQEVRSR